MRQTKFFLKTVKESPADETALNARLLIRAGYIDKLMAGAYSYLPLGLKVLEKIKNVVREEMNRIDAQEILMPALQPKSLWDETGRWEEMKDIMFQFKGRGGSDLGQGATHEEPIFDIMRRRLKSYKDLPVAVYQIQDKFRNEPRAKSGLLRGREFSMKDLYSFHATRDDMLAYYDRVKLSYLTIFERLGLNAIAVEASGGAFSEDYSHEFQVLTPNGEDIIFHCDCGWAQNKEIAKVKEGDKCPSCGAEKIRADKGVEVGNIFKLEQKYSAAMKLSVTDQNGKLTPVYMGCYGLGPSRLMGTLVEIHHDDSGIVWPDSVAPFKAHLLLLSQSTVTKEIADNAYAELQKSGVEVLYDDRPESPGAKLTEADLVGLPVRIIVSDKNNGLLEYKRRSSAEIKKIAIKDLVSEINKI
ncbi:MAG: His/Gly/Thr/Pro-type tRNA ligase C-terminal domain-containing protein [Candidatus Komeilibacteria bacterium]|nr:His/Gly/Thr/Pro-type tRNA ligase C-terminal domain-containing protein [Candidatus Komeilibacteria bacterium]